MNQAIKELWSWVEGTQGMRIAMLDSLSDGDLAYNPGGQNMTLGVLCREIGEVQYSYIQSFQNFKQEWSYRNTEAGMESSTARLKEWYQSLDAELKETLTALSDEDMQKLIDRGPGFQVPVAIQLDIYLQALLIFFGKASIYLKAMNKSLGQMADWIG